MGRAASLGGIVRAIFPLTIRGLVILLMSAALFAAGALRADLAALFWGSSFLLFTFYCLVVGHLFRLSLRRRRTRSPDFLSFVLPAEGLPRGIEAMSHASARLPRAFPPGFSVRLSLPLAWHDRRIDAVGARLPPGESRKSVAFRPAHRGVFTSAAAVLEARDLLGFTSHRLRVEQRESLTVFPEVRTADAAPPVMEQADEAAPQARRRRRSEELLEARKYYPGDDVRRLNWKVFAHTDELFLRIGEEVPPPEARILFALDLSPNPRIPASLCADYLDGLVEACAASMIALMVKGVDVMLSLPGIRECASYSDETRAALLAALADAWWTDAPWAPDLPARPVHAAVWSSPGSPGLERIMTSVRTRGWGASLFLRGLPHPAPAPRPSLSGLLFLPRGPAERTKPPAIRRKERELFRAALERDLAFYRGPAWKVRHAAEV
jgi:uncharacterized protein (DUF58 family)